MRDVGGDDQNGIPSDPCQSGISRSEQLHSPAEAQTCPLPCLMPASPLASHITHILQVEVYLPGCDERLGPQSLRTPVKPEWGVQGRVVGG